MKSFAAIPAVVFGQLLLTLLPCSALHAQSESPQQPASHIVASPPDSDLATPRGRQSTAQAMPLRSAPVRVLPSFSVTSRDGQPTVSSALVRSSNWLLLYRTENCLPCDRLMNVLAASNNAALLHGAGMVVVIAGTTQQNIDKVRLGFPNLSDATWFADPQAEGLKALKAEGTPTLMALHGGRIEWTTSGNLGNPTTVESLAASWLQQAQANRAALANPQGK